MEWCSFCIYAGLLKIQTYVYSKMCLVYQYIEVLSREFFFQKWYQIIWPNIMSCLRIQVYLAVFFWFGLLGFFFKVFWQMQEFCEAPIVELYVSDILFIVGQWKQEWSLYINSQIFYFGRELFVLFQSLLTNFL